MATPAGTENTSNGNTQPTDISSKSTDDRAKISHEMPTQMPTSDGSCSKSSQHLKIEIGELESLSPRALVDEWHRVNDQCKRAAEVSQVDDLGVDEAWKNLDLRRDEIEASLGKIEQADTLALADMAGILAENLSQFGGLNDRDREILRAIQICLIKMAPRRSDHSSNLLVSEIPEQPSGPDENAIYDAFEALNAARLTYETAGDSQDQSRFAAYQLALHRFFVTKTELPWAIYEKHVFFERECLAHGSDFGDRRDMVWFAGLKADALNMASNLRCYRN